MFGAWLCWLQTAGSGVSGDSGSGGRASSYGAGSLLERADSLDSTGADDGSGDRSTWHRVNSVSRSLRQPASLGSLTRV